MTRGDLLIDSSWLITMYDNQSESHDEIKENSKRIRGQLLIPQVVLTEVVYLLKRKTGIQGRLTF
jgi:predicted nucleic acid-binding protein